MLRMDQDRRNRVASAAMVALYHALILYAFLRGIGLPIDKPVDEELKLIDIIAPPPPPPAKAARPQAAEEKKKPRPKNAEGAASPANLRNTPSEIVAPPREIRIPVPPPVPAAPVAGQGTAVAAGATNVPGPGTGSGGRGNGLGSGDRGNGTGGGGGGGGTHARWIRGAIDGSDYPRRAYEARRSGNVFLSFVVAPDGRVSSCRVTRSSGTPELDAITCRLIRERFRYRPARAWDGRPIAETIRGEHVWELGPEPPPIDVEPDIPD
jgi:protein TonB